MRKIWSPQAGELVRATLPCLAEQAFNILSGVLATIIVGRLGAYEMTGTSMANTVYNWLNCLLVGFSTGATVVVGRMCGMKDEKGVRDVAFQTMKLTMLIGIVIAVLIMLLKKPLVMFFYGSAEVKVLENVHIYLFLLLLGMPASAGVNSMNACLRGIGDNKTPMSVSVLLNVATLFFCFLLVYGFAPLNIPEMGIWGAGIAVTGSRYIGMIYEAVVILIKRKNLIPSKYKFGIDAGVMKKVMKISTPASLEQFIFNGGFVILQSLLAGFGTVFQAGYQIGTNVSSITQTIPVALNLSLVALISQSLGAKNEERAKEYVRIVRLITCTIIVAVCVLTFIAAPWLARMYSTEENVIEEGIYFVRVFAVMLFPIAYMQAMSGVLKGAGDAKYIMFTSVSAMWIFRIFGIWALSRLIGDGHIAVIAGLAGDFVLRAVVYDARIRREKWLHIKL